MVQGSIEIVTRALAVELSGSVKAEVATDAVGVRGSTAASVLDGEEGAAAGLTRQANLARRAGGTNEPAIGVV